jgi:RimJ/RimL family protein N-acetyltransferase
MADPILMRHMGRERFSYEEAEAALERHLHHWDRHGFGLWAAEDKQTGELIGRVGLSYHRLWPHDPEVGWLIDTPWQGRGLATEAGAASIRYAFEHLGVERIVSICTPENASSRRVMAGSVCAEFATLMIRSWVSGSGSTRSTGPGFHPSSRMSSFARRRHRHDVVGAGVSH